MPLFGKIVDAEMRLSLVGEIVAEEWQRKEQIRPNVSLDEWGTMPNHIHGIIVINEPHNVKTPRRGVSTTTGGDKSWKPGTLGSIINQFKSKCTK
jgi:REP element-mobilizing transposase RayT